MIEAALGRLARTRTDRQHHRVGLADRIDDAASRAHVDSHTLRPRAFKKGLELIVEEFAEREARVEGAFTDLVGVDAERHEPTRRLRLEPFEKRLLKRRDLDARNVREHRRIVPAGPIGRPATRGRLLLVNGELEGAAGLIKKERAACRWWSGRLRQRLSRMSCCYNAGKAERVRAIDADCNIWPSRSIRHSPYASRRSTFRGKDRSSDRRARSRAGPSPPYI